jgi:DNA-directed RNA polymerase specialized sigma subunit
MDGWPDFENFEVAEILSDDDKLLFMMRFRLGFTQDELAMLYKVSQSAISRWLGKIKKQIAEFYGYLRRSESE